jgi:membrane-bound metal-dependent hydrolase YbcI (DUF457 family)
MFILGHVGITIGILAFILFKKPEWSPKFDLRWLAIGALLPDIIDKTIGLFLFQGYIDNGRIFTHSLLTAFIITGIAGYTQIRPTLSISFGIWTHIIFDRMWEVPETLLWPFLRLDFPSIDFEPGMWLHYLMTDPYIYSTEIFGASILLFLFFYYKLYQRDNFIDLFRTGKFSQ